MKQFTGFLFIIILVPLLLGIQQAIAKEWDKTRHLKAQAEESIKLTEPLLTLPISIVDRNGRVFAEEYVEWRDPLPLNKVPVFLIDLFLESEDKGFFEHRGYDVAAIVRAFAVNTAKDDLQQGGSTITQQLVRLRFLTTEKTYERKFKELLYAAELENQSTKDEILEMYLNEMYFGNKVYGIGAAATYYFNRPLDKLSPAEMAFIAAIPNNPSRYDPLKYFDRTKNRQELLLTLIAKSGTITEKEAELWKKETITLNLKEKANEFTMYSSLVLSELEELVGHSERTAEILAKGVRIETALYPQKQKQDETSISSLLAGSGVQAGAVVIENKTREIVSIYGGRDYKKADFNRAYQAVRQPGSAIKPLLVYAPFFESGPYDESTLIDSSNLCIASYCPKNIGGFTYGMTTVKEAFRYSHNTAAVRVFGTVGIDNAFAFLKPFEFNNVNKTDHTYPAALGGFQRGVTPLELASAYTSFIDGTFEKPHAIRRVVDRDGNILYSWEDKAVKVWSPSTVSTIRKLMMDVVLNGTGQGITNTTSYTGAKTGTTDHYKDLWVAGMNDNYTTAVWIGHDKPASIQRLSNQKIHLKAFNELMKD
ncbi:transglycosylase domain-containing protein [Sporosarcina highlanderae]|uniref:Transglycosylase domain-containing protein n=1 Tax=Sporosarcina highlanderae TaxID=3035916 RepID=A0ABT8JV82_9BACL|nr:transglycosylase domain-containing protein [Sporosarcina highlanderae]MDN4609081.1 transglycosylase domain-containing protein [Sporosarcina highlanderae]